MATAQPHIDGAQWEWIPPIAAAFISVLATANLPAWVAMWALCFTLYGGFKWLTWRRAMRVLRPRPAAVRSHPPFMRHVVLPFLTALGA